MVASRARRAASLAADVPARSAASALSTAFCGAHKVQSLKPADIEAWHTTLRTKGRKDGSGGVGAHTIRGAHRVLSKALRDAVRFNLALRNAAGKEGQTAPRTASGDTEVEIISLDRLPDLLAKLHGRAISCKVITARSSFDASC